MRKISLFHIGARGVNTVSDPLNVDPTELTKAQNAEYILDAGEGSLAQRPGMVRVNSTALTGTVVLAFDVALKTRAEYTSYLYAGMVNPTATWRRSTDGTTWTDVAAPARIKQFTSSIGYFKEFTKVVTLNNKLYFFTNDATIRLREWDGTTDRDVGPIPANRTTVPNTDALLVMDAITDGTYIYIAVIDRTTTEPNLPGRVFQVHPKVGTFTQIGGEFGASPAFTNGCPSSLAIHNGYLYVGTYTGTGSGNTARIYRKHLLGIPSNPLQDWITDHTTAASLGSVCSMASFRGRLYAGVASHVAGTAAIVKERNEEGVWSTSRTGPATTVSNAYTSLFTFNSNLYAGWTDAGTTAARLEQFDGTTWTNDQSFATTDVVCQGVTFLPGTGSLYVVLGRTSAAGNTTSSIKKRTTGGTWSTADDPADDFRGAIGILRG